MREKKRLVIFVRYRSAAEGISRELLNAGLPTDYLHGLRVADRAEVLSSFRKGPPSILIVTRSLFGRGFDLPQANAAIFYSPKTSEKTTWQEFLRIRSNIRTTKQAYLLYYAWTAEAEKWNRLLRKILASNGMPHMGGYRWQYTSGPVAGSYSASNEAKSAQDSRIHDYNQEPQSTTDESVASKFAEAAFNVIVAAFYKPQIDAAIAVENCAKSTGFISEIAPSERWSISEQLSSSAIQIAEAGKGDTKRVYTQLVKRFHPDKDYMGATKEMLKLKSELLKAWNMLR
jgi:superfamily II DNA/RNA helicase